MRLPRLLLLSAALLGSSLGGALEVATALCGVMSGSASTGELVCPLYVFSCVLYTKELAARYKAGLNQSRVLLLLLGLSVAGGLP